MSSQNRTEQGFVLLISMILLLLLAIIGVGMFRTVSQQHHLIANIRDKQVALSNAITAEQFAEWWILQGNGSANTGTCTRTATVSTAMACTNSLQNPSTPPWTALDTSSTSHVVGVTYTPPSNMQTTSTSGGSNTVYANPGFYVQNIGTSPDGQGALYQITAYGYGGSSTSVGVVQSTYEVTSGIINRGGL